MLRLSGDKGFPLTVVDKNSIVSFAEAGASEDNVAVMEQLLKEWRRFFSRPCTGLYYCLAEPKVLLICSAAFLMAPRMSVDAPAMPRVEYAPLHEATGRPVSKSMKLTVTTVSSCLTFTPYFTRSNLDCWAGDNSWIFISLTNLSLDCSTASNSCISYSISSAGI